MPKIILASSSPYRKSLLERLGVPFTCEAPNIDESSIQNSLSQPKEIATTLAFKKADAIYQLFPDSLVIGGDQVLSFEHRLFGKPHTKEKALTQLEKFNGKTHQLITAICVLYQGQTYPLLDQTSLTMRKHTREQLQKYIELDNPLDCAGSYKIEENGIRLFSKIETSDYSAITGLPLISLSNLFTQLDIPIL